MSARFLLGMATVCVATDRVGWRSTCCRGGSLHSPFRIRAEAIANPARSRAQAIDADDPVSDGRLRSLTKRAADLGSTLARTFHEQPRSTGALARWTASSALPYLRRRATTPRSARLCVLASEQDHRVETEPSASSEQTAAPCTTWEAQLPWATAVHETSGLGRGGDCTASVGRRIFRRCPANARVYSI